MKYAPPVPGARICSYQYEVREREAYTTTHLGVDLCGDCGDPIYAPLGGRVKDIHTTTLGGLTLVIQHSAAVFTRYAHTQELLVHPGQKIRQGQLIGIVGRSGQRADGSAVGCHLHFAATNVWVPPGTRIYREADHLNLREWFASIGIVEEDRKLVWMPGYPKSGVGLGTLIVGGLLLGAGAAAAIHYSR